MLEELGPRSVDRYARVLRRMRKKATPKRVHRLRVRTKKLRSLLRLARSMSPDVKRPKVAIHRLKVLFKAAGIARDAQVIQGVVDGLRNAPAKTHEAYTARLDRRKARGHCALGKAMKDLRGKDMARLRSCIARSAKGHDPKAQRAAARRYVADELREARTLLRSEKPEDVLHSVRKHVKNAWHVLNLPIANGGRNSLTEGLKHLQENLGLWHDARMALTDLREWRNGDDDHLVLIDAVEKLMARRQRKLMPELREVLGVS